MWGVSPPRDEEKRKRMGQLEFCRVAPLYIPRDASMPKKHNQHVHILVLYPFPLCTVIK